MYCYTEVRGVLAIGPPIHSEDTCDKVTLCPNINEFTSTTGDRRLATGNSP